MYEQSLEQALSADVIRPIYLTEIKFKNGTTRCHTGVGDKQLRVEDVTEIKPWKPGDWTHNNGTWTRRDTPDHSMLYLSTRQPKKALLEIEIEVVSWSKAQPYLWAMGTAGRRYLKNGANKVVIKNVRDAVVWVNSDKGSMAVKGIKVHRLETFRGIGNFGKVSEVSQSKGLRPNRLNLTLSAFDATLRGEALRAQYINCPVKLWLACLDRDHQIIAAEMQRRGKVSDCDVSIGNNNTIKLTVSDRFEDLEKGRPDRYTDESQQIRHSEDRGLQYVSRLPNHEFYWGGKKASIPLKDAP